MENLGINFIQVISYIVIFFLLYIFAKKFIDKTIKTTEERKLQIEEGLRNAEEAHVLKSQKLKEAEQEKQAMISDAYKQAGTIIDGAKEKEVQIIDEAKGNAQQIMVDASKELEEIKIKSKNDGLREAREIISIAVKKSFEGLEIDEKTEQKLIENALNQVK